uniref:Uncharacterized protein n=1 Tax=Oryza glumipatula TaxID=40148 RepID=A0A0E0A9S0_9ORYZ
MVREVDEEERGGGGLGGVDAALAFGLDARLWAVESEHARVVNPEQRGVAMARRTASTTFATVGGSFYGKEEGTRPDFVVVWSRAVRHSSGRHTGLCGGCGAARHAARPARHFVEQVAGTFSRLAGEERMRNRLQGEREWAGPSEGRGWPREENDRGEGVGLWERKGGPKE